MKRPITTTVASTLTVVAAATNVNAQQAGSSFQVEEIVVTARRVEESLQSTPVTVSAFTERALETRGITDTVELANFIPNATFDTESTFSGAASTFQGFIRGIGQSDFAINTDPGVGVYIDDVYIARTVGAVFELYDIQQVEVLKGPQGTLFGRNSIGGAINIRTKRPDNKFSAHGSVAFGRFDYIGVDAAANLPISDHVFASVAVASRQQDGFQGRVLPDLPGLKNIVSADMSQATARNGGAQGRLDNQSIRTKLLWEAGERLKTTFSADYSRARDGAPAQAVLSLIGSQEAADVGTDALGLNPSSLSSLFNGCVLGLAPAPVCATSGEFGIDIFNVNGDSNPANDIPLFGDWVISNDIDTSFGTGANFSNFDSYGFSNVLLYELSKDIQLKSIASYRELEADFGTDLDGSPLPINNTTFSIDQNQFSYELQVNGSALDSRLSYTLGGFYFEEEAVQADQVLIGSVLQIGGDNSQNTRAAALFGEANYDITDKLSAIFGLRYTDERKRLQIDQQSLTKFFGIVMAAPFPSGFLEDDEGDLVFPRLNADGSPNVNFLGPDGTQEANFDDASIRTGLHYQINNDVFAYLTFSQGFKSGGFTTRLTAPFNPEFNPSSALIGADIPPGLATLVFHPEKSDAYELGVKTDLFNGKIRANAAIFWNKYKDIQIVVTRGISPANENAGDGIIRGLELELEAYPSDKLALMGSFGYTDAEYANIDPLAFPITEDSRFQNTPEVNFSLAGNFVQPVGRGELVFNLNYSWRSKVVNDAQNTPELIQSSVGLLGGHIKYQPGEGNWTLSLIGRNITDERFIGGGYNSGTGASLVTAIFNRPAEWRLQLNFGL